MPTIYLHLGLPKTGTKTIQNFLWRNRDALKAHDICFPDPGFRYKAIDFHRNGRFLTRFDSGSAQDASQYQEGLSLLEELGSQFGRIVLSDEDFWGKSRFGNGYWEHLAQDFRKRGFDARLIVYVRRQDLWVESFWAQKIKMGKTTLGFRDFLEDILSSGYPLDYYRNLDELSGIWGKDALIVRVFEREQFKGSDHTLQSDFLDILGLPGSDGFVSSKSRYNLKLEGGYLELKRVLNQLPQVQDDKASVFIPPLKEVQASNPPGRHSFFAPEERMEFLNGFAESNRRVAREYLKRDDGLLFHEDPAEFLPAEAYRDELLHSAILVYGHMFLSLSRENETLRLEIQKLKETANALNQETRKLQGRVDALRHPLRKLLTTISKTGQ